MTEYTIGDRVAPRVSLRLGGVPYLATSSTVTTALSKRSEAHFALDMRFLAPVDLTAPVDFIAPGPSGDPGGPGSRPIFSGHITQAHLDHGLLAVNAEGALELAESTTGAMQASDVHGVELVYALARDAGFTDDRLQIQGIEDFDEEVFVVDMLVSGMHVSEPVNGAGVTITPVADEKSLGAFEGFVSQTTSGGPTARFRVYVIASLMYDAQTRGVERIHTVLDTLLATSAYGLSRDPWGRAVEFDRERLRARPSALPFVFVHGVASRRRWVRELTSEVKSSHLDIEKTFTTWSRLLETSPSPEVRRALRALGDAADDSRDAFDRCHSISTALEYYAASSKPPAAVTGSSLKASKKAVKELGLPLPEQQRLLEVMGRSNDPPLFARVRHQATLDSVPMTEGEWGLLRKLRDARNGSVHGHSGQETPSIHDLRWGVSVSSRLLLHRWAAEQ